jgi:hypothetical protein
VTITPLPPTSATVSITASGFAYFVRVLSPALGARFSDNYVDLRAGDTKVIMVEGLPEGFQRRPARGGVLPGRLGLALPGHGLAEIGMPS